ncbi:unnamed protein product [Peronospora farinosa]|uniref:Uncharacterized protein n=1 Tax=Peronospora farinosa TaxID=134698 RepID=A0ABN8C5E4_9STRA|nr:unnamed protein product [Peronospora farinosa]
MWRLMRQSSDNVFKLLKLDKIDKLDKIATEGTKLFETQALRTHYGDGANLATLFYLGKWRSGDKHIADLAAALQVAQLKKWDMKTVKDVLKILELDKTQDNQNPFINPLFSQLLAYVKLKHPNDPTAVTKELLTAFREFYTDNKAWAKFLVDGTRTDSVKKIAYDLLQLQLPMGKEGEEALFTLLELDQIENGLVDEVFMLLKLENGLFESPRMLLWLDFVERYFIKAEKYATKEAADRAKLNYTAKKAAEEADAVAEEAQKAADEAAEEANAAASEAKKAADAAARKAEEAENVVLKAPYEAMLLTLRHHSKSDSALRNSLAKGLEVDNWKVRQTAKELQKMLDSSRPQEDLSKVSAPGAELDSNFDVHG